MNNRLPYKETLPDHLHKPSILTSCKEVREILPGTPFQIILKKIKRKENICLSGTYGFALSFHSWLKKHVSKSIPIVDYLSSRAHRKVLHQYQSKVLVRVEEGTPILDKAPDNPWLKAFYPEERDYLIVFSEFLGMNGARQWFEKGIKYPFINHPIHPFYGVYFPTRYGHLHLFDCWMASEKDYRQAVDVGAGCGILSFIMRKHGIKNILATDINPNAIFSIKEELRRIGNDPNTCIIPEQTDLLGSFRPGPEDLVVCNPPWLPGTAENWLDEASYYPSGFFDRFFNELKDRCAAGASIAILFSDFALVAGITQKHPIEETLGRFGNHFRLEAYDKEPVAEKIGKQKSWIADIRSKEHIELFVLKKT